MRKLGVVVLVLVVVAAVAATVLYAQGAGGGRGAGRGAAAGPMETERMKMMLQTLGLSETEMAAVEKSMQTKMAARQALQDDLGKLRQVAENPASTDKQLDEAVDSYKKALARYRETVQADDAALSKQLSPRSRARALAAGILDNGLGGGGRMRMGGGGRMGGAGGGGQMGGRPGATPE